MRSTHPLSFLLFLTNINIDRSSREMPFFTHLVFQETTIRFFHILRQIRKEHERRNLRIRQLSTILDLDVFAFG